MSERKKGLKIIAWLVAFLIHGTLIYLTPHWDLGSFMIGTFTEAMFLLGVLAAIDNAEGE